MSGIVNKVKDAIHPNRDHTTGTTTHSTTGTTGTHSGLASEGQAGPHTSRVANAADPRIDSDLDGSRRAGGVGTGNSTYGSGVTGGTTGTGYGNTSTNAGPHDSNLANKLDPRVDSDLDGSSRIGAGTTSTTTGTGAGYGGSHVGNTTGHHTGATGGLSNSTNAGPHNSNLANKVDPRVDSDLDGRGNRHGANTGGIFGASGSHATPGSGTAQNTAGPHNSDLANKLDPRVDADLDGSTTIGGNRTHA